MVRVHDFNAASFPLSNGDRGLIPTWFNHFYFSVMFFFIVGVRFFYLDRNFYAGRYPTLSQLELKRHTCTNN